MGVNPKCINNLCFTTVNKRFEIEHICRGVTRVLKLGVCACFLPNEGRAAKLQRAWPKVVSPDARQL